MPYQIEKSSENNWSLFKDSDLIETIQAKRRLDLVYKIIKRLLYRYAWNSPEHDTYLAFLNRLRKVSRAAGLAYNAVTIGDPKKAYTRLASFFESREVEKKSEIAYDSDYSNDSDYPDDSDDECISHDGNSNSEKNTGEMEAFPGSDLANKNQKIKALQNTFLAQLRALKTGVSYSEALISNEVGYFREAIKVPYKAHLAQGKVMPFVHSISKVTQVEDRKFSIAAKKHSGKSFTFTAFRAPSVVLFRGLGYFADRWHAESRRAHREDLAPQSLFSEATLQKHLGQYPGQSYARFFQQPSISREYGKKFLIENARALKGNLIQLRNSEPIIVKQGSNYRFFTNLLEYMQHLYTNGIARFQVFIKELHRQCPQFNGFFPSSGNPFISMSELGPHAMRYAMGLKEPYSQYAIAPRFNAQGKPENPYIGKFYVTLHPVADFTGHDKPHIIREMHREGSVTTRNAIGPELEVSFLGRISEHRFQYAQKVRVPSFHRKVCPQHYFKKYGIDKPMYLLIRHLLMTLPIHDKKRTILERNLKEYLNIYHAVRLMLWQFDQANKNKRIIVFLDEGSEALFTTDIPRWGGESSGRLSQDLESEEAKALIEKKNLKPMFYVKGGTVFENQQLKIFSVSEEVLPKKWKKNIKERRRNSFGGKDTRRESFGHLSDLQQRMRSLSLDGKPSDIDFGPLSGHNEFPHELFESNDDDLIHHVFRPAPTTLHDGSAAWECDVLGEGDCLFYSMIIAYLLPHVNDKEVFISGFIILFGHENIQSLEDLRIAFQSYSGDAKWCYDYLYNLVNGEYGLRKRLAQLFITKDHDFFQKVAQQFEENSLTERIYAHIEAEGSYGNQGELMIFAALTNIHVHFYNGFQDVSIAPDGTIVDIADTSKDQAHISVRFTNADPNSEILNHYHCLVPRDQLADWQNSLLEAKQGVPESPEENQMDAPLSRPAF